MTLPIFPRRLFPGRLFSGELFSSRRQDGLEQLVRETRDIATWAASTTAELRESIDALTRAVADLAAREERVSGWRVVRLWSSVAVLFGLAVALALAGTTAFTDVNASGDGRYFGGVGFYLTDAPDSAARRTVQLFAEYNAEGDVTTYNFDVPMEYVGHDFLIVLTGTAAMSEAPSVSKIGPGNMTVHIDTDTCFNDIAAEGPCMEISGRVPPSPATFVNMAAWGCADGEQPSDSRYTSFTVTGRSRAKVDVDAFHTIVAMAGPRYLARSYEVGGRQVTSPPDDMSAVSLDVCRLLTTDPGQEIKSSSVAVTASGEDEHFWDFSSTRGGGVNVLISRRDADRWANVSLAAAGVLAGVAVGVFPMAVEAGGAYRRRRRRAAGV